MLPTGPGGQAAGAAAWPNHVAAKAMTPVPREVNRTSNRPTEGQSHEVSKASRPVTVAASTTGVTSRLASGASRGKPGLISICTGRVPAWAHRVVANGRAKNPGRWFSRKAVKRRLPKPMPSTAPQESAKPKLAAIEGCRIRISRTHQDSVFKDWVGRHAARANAERSPIACARNTESPGTISIPKPR